jgi:hypothetical protein
MSDASQLAAWLTVAQPVFTVLLGLLVLAVVVIIIDDYRTSP